VAHQERRLLDGIVADRDNQVGTVDRLVNPIPVCTEKLNPDVVAMKSAKDRI
jgi:hypothetical protein